MTAVTKINDVFVQNDSQNISSVIQQAKNVKQHPFHPLYEVDTTNNDFAAHPNSAFEQANSSMVQFLKPFANQTPSIVANSSQQEINQQNTLYVIDSNRKLNILDTAHQPTLLKRNYGEKADPLHSLGDNVKKYADTLYSGVNLASEHPLPPPSNLRINDYFNAYLSVANANVSNDTLSSHNNAPNASFSQSAQVPRTESNDNPRLPPPPPPPQSANNERVTHTRGRKKSKKGPFICSECRKEFSNQSTLTKHMITHSDERKFVCSQCSKAFKRHDHLNGHMLTHREHKPYACDIEGCDKSYCDARSLRRHKEKHKENAIQTSEGLALTQKIPNLVTVSDKAASSNIYLPINASAQLQYLALQQQKTQTTTDTLNHHEADNTSFPKINSSEKAMFNMNEVNIGKNHEANLAKVEIPHNGPHQETENALLHQLLTSQDKNIKPQLNYHNNSTVIKVNDNYTNVSNNLTVNYIQIVNPVKDSCSPEKSNFSNENFPSTSKLNNMNLEPKATANETHDSNLLDCFVCQKNFKTFSALNEHVRLHGEFFKLNYLLNSKADPNEMIDKSASRANLENINANVQVESYQHGKHYDIGKDSYTFEDDQSKEYNELNLYEKSSEMLYHPDMNRHIVQNEFKMPLNYVNNHADKMNLLDQANIYQTPLMYKNEPSMLLPESHFTENLVSNDQSKQLNEVMFSPITPVTPLKNNSQFTFEFSTNSKTPDNKIEAISLCKPDQVHFPESDLVESNFCFDSSKNNDLLQKADIEIENIDINNSHETFNDLDNNHLNAQQEFSTETSINKNIESHREDYFDTNKSESFHNFDLPSCKLTSDLYNRRIRRNMDDSSKTRELLSIKQIAASLQSFSQSYERNHQNSLNQQMSHSYSVPTTPCMASSQFANQPQAYQMNMSHHSLPATPIDSTHFTFKVSNNIHQTSLPNTPLENEQHFHFGQPAETEPPEDILNSRSFDLSCLNDSQYSDFIYNTKELDSDFIDNASFKDSNMLPYNTETSNTNNIGNCDKNIEDIDFVSHDNNKQYSHHESFSYGRDSFTQSINKTVSSTLQTEKVDTCLDKCNGAIIEDNFHDNRLNIEKFFDNNVAPSKDINANYITTSLEFDKKNEEKMDADGKSKCANKSPSCLKSFMKKHIVQGHCNPMQVSFKKKKPRPEPLYIPPHVNTFVYHSRLRSPRIWNTSTMETKHISPPPYTPPPMLSPVRSGSGLFWKITNSTLLSSKCYSNLNSAKFSKKPIFEQNENLTDLKTPTTAYEPYEYDIPQTDIQPHVNIGPNFQARIPAFNHNRNDVKYKLDKDNLLWDPTVLDNISEDELDLYLKVSCSLCVPGKGSNKEYALHLLYDCKGKVTDALTNLLNSNPTIKIGHPLSGYSYANNCVWSSEEISLFRNSILSHDKDFYMISQEIQTKTVKECVEFYYIWKKNSPDVMRKLRFVRRKREHESLFYDIQSKCQTNSTQRKNQDKEIVNGIVACQDSGQVRFKRVKAPYSCAKCGRKFKKLKSRTAHMKTHGNN